MEGEINAHRQTVIHHGGGQTAVKSGSQVIRVALHGVGDVQQALGGQPVAPHHIGAHSACHQQSGGRTQAPAHRDMGIDVNLHATDFLAERSQHSAVRHISQIVGTGEFLRAAGDLQTKIRFLKGHIGIKTQCAAKGVKAGAKVGGGGRHTDGYSFHCQTLLFSLG